MKKMPNDIVKTSSDIENVDWSTGSAHYANVVRFGSSSSQASQSSGDICRICHCEADPKNPLLTPCYCSGSLKYVHQTCLQQWLTASGTTSCELCKFPFIMHTKIKPFNEWRSLDMSGVERRRLCCSILFHCAAALCVIWSLCVLIERATQEVKNGEIGWPFWTKLGVVTVGLTGGIVFMYIQCRQYLHLCHRWRARNRILLIQNAPEKIRQLSQPSPVLHGRNVPQISNVTSPATAMTANNSFNCNSYNYCAATVGACGASNAIVNLNSQNNNTQFVVGNNSSVSYQSVPQHGQIVANIENSSQAYDRDWTLDDVSQISSFRPCPQGSGSMTPFHDSVNNVIETNSRSSSNSVSGSRQDLNMSMPNSSNNHNNQTNLQQNTNTNRNIMNRTNDLDSFKPPSTANNNNNNNSNVMGVIPSASISLSSSNRYPNSSVFLENRDILNDADYPKINYRHSSILTSPDITDNLDKFLGKDLRRYSDTKLLTNDDDILNPILNVEIHTNNDCNVENDKTIINIEECRNKAIDKPSVSETLFQNILGIRNVVMPQKITDIIFESATNLNPKIIDLDKRQNSNRKKMRRSLNTVENDESFETEPNPPIDKNRMYFKSLPNLSSSCESLIKK